MLPLTSRGAHAIARFGRLAGTVAALVLAMAPTAIAQQGEGKSRIEELEKKNRELEIRLERLEEINAIQEEEADLLFEPGEDYGFVFRYGDVVTTFELFGDVGFRWDEPERPGNDNSVFALGAIDLFVNAQVGDHFRILSETVLNGQSDDSFDIVQMRLLGMYEFGDWLYVKLGTDHTRLNRWNQLYHHGRYLQVSVGRPLVARFERMGGIMPIHFTGIEIGGVQRPGEFGGVEYWASVSNGRGPVPTDSQRTRDQNSGKRLEAGLALVPAAIPGFRIGGGFSHDDIPSDPNSSDPNRALSTKELIASGHVEFEDRGLHVLGELSWIDHESRATGRSDTNHAGYLQVAYSLDAWTPYTRFDYRNMSEGDPFFMPSNRDLGAWEQVLGIRYDFEQNVALKLEFAAGERDIRNGASVDQRTSLFAGFQLSWGL